MVFDDDVEEVDGDILFLSSRALSGEPFGIPCKSTVCVGLNLRF